MALSDFISYVKDREKTLVVYNSPADSTLVAELQAYFETQNVVVESQHTNSGEPAGVVVLRQDDEVLASVPTDKLRELLDGGGIRDTGVGIDDAEYHEILGHLKETTFTSYDKSQMVTISHEIEDRALRVNKGTLYAGFQQPSKLRAQRDRYERLASQPLAVHTFAVPGESVEIPGVTHHAEPTAEIERSWFVIFDGDGEDNYKTALLATERAPNQFYGFWSDDPELVDSIETYLDSAYLKLSP